MEERWFVFGFANGEERIVLAASDFEDACSIVYGQATGGPIIPLNHCLIEWGPKLSLSEGASIH